MSSLPDPKLVVFKHSLHKNKTENEIGTIIIQQISLLGDLKKYKFDSEFILYVCNLVEHLVGLNKFDKKKIVLNVIGSVFSLNINETEVISNAIEFLHSNQLIKKVEQEVQETFLTKINKIFNIGKKRYIRKIGTTGFTITKKVTTNFIKNYTIDNIITPLLTSKLGISSQVVLLVIIAFL